MDPQRTRPSTRFVLLRKSFLYRRRRGRTVLAGRYCAGSTNLEIAQNHDVRMAEAGELMKRAFLNNGRIDLYSSRGDFIDIIEVENRGTLSLAVSQNDGTLSL